MNLTESNNASMRVFSLQVKQEGEVHITQDVLNNFQTNVCQSLTLIQIAGFAVLLANVPKISELANNFVRTYAIEAKSLDFSLKTRL